MGVAEAQVEEIVQHLTTGIAVEGVQTDHAAPAAAGIPVGLDLVADLFVRVERPNIGDLGRCGIEVDVGLGFALALGQDVLQREVF